MRKKLVKIGNSLGIIIPPALLDLMGVNVKGSSMPELELNFDGKAITITPVKEED